MCSCNEGYEGAYCQVTTTSTSELLLPVGLGILLPITAILVVIIISTVFIYRRQKATDLKIKRLRRINNALAPYVASAELMYVNPLILKGRCVVNWLHFAIQV